MLQVEHGTRTKSVEKLRINLGTAYGIVLGQCTDYIRSRLEVQEKWERTSNKRYLLELLQIIKYLSHEYYEDMEYHHVAYHTLICHFMLFCQGDSSNLENKQQFKDQIEVLEAYNGGILFINSTGDTVCEIKLL